MRTHTPPSFSRLSSQTTHAVRRFVRPQESPARKLVQIEHVDSGIRAPSMCLHVVRIQLRLGTSIARKQTGPRGRGAEGV